MDTQKIFTFLRGIAAHNERQWFQDHKTEYLAARESFEAGVTALIHRITEFDDSIAHLTAKDTMYRFNRDTRFSTDKSPYKRHFGAFICAHGRKSLRGGYYIHLEPGQCVFAVGNYWLPTNILTSCRNEIMANEEEWLKRVENPDFLHWYGAPEQTEWEAPQGFGFERLKTCPTGFPKDYPYLRYLRMKNYCCWHRVDDDYFEGEAWLDQIIPALKAGKPMMDFTNSVIDDYE